jgi:uncharacterized protein (TIRG00374 family)
VKQKIQLLAGVALGVALLWWLFRETNWAAAFRAVQEADWRWLAAAEVLVIISFFTRVQRWVYIVRAVKPVSYRHLFSATQIGFLANFVLPLRAGEVVRSVVLSRHSGLPFTKCFALVALDRVTDLFGLILVMLVAAVAFHPEGAIHLPEDLLATPVPADVIQKFAWASAGTLCIIVLAFVLLYVAQGLVLRISDAILGLVSRGLAARVHALLEHFAQGMHVFRSAREMSWALVFSLITWIIGVYHYGFILNAFHFEPPWYAGFVVMALMAVAISLPSTPGFVGPFHVAIVAAVLFTSPGADVDAARAAAILAHLMNLLPIVIIGAYCLYKEQFGLLALRQEAEVQAHAEKEEVV